MKFQLVHDGYGDYGDEEFAVYITRNEIIKAYETDVKRYYNILIRVSEMLTSPCCYYHEWKEQELHEIYRILNENKKFKGFLLRNRESDKGNYLDYGYIKK